MEASYDRICKVDGCGMKYHAKGYCRRHYENRRYIGLEGTFNYCTIEGCNKKRHSKLYCYNHQRMFRWHGDPLYAEKKRNLVVYCSYNGCSNIEHSKGFCTKHYARFKKHGDPSILQRIYGHDVMQHPLYATYAGMKSRCSNPNSNNYKDYGGRGIKVHESWLGAIGFYNFLADMGNKPSSKHSLERIDNNGNYTPENCKWETIKNQSNNRRSNSLITYGGKTQNIQQWADEVGLSRSCINYRIKAGYSTYDVLFKPLKKINFRK